MSRIPSIIPYLLHVLQSEQVGQIGINLFIDKIPSNIQSAIILKQYDGYVCPEIKSLRRASFQIIARAEDEESAINLATKASDALWIDQMDLGDVLVYNCRPVDEPINVSTDQIGEATFVVNCQVIWQ